MYLIVASIVAKIVPMFLLMPVLMVVLPISGVAGVVYAIGHNRAGQRIRLFGDDDKGRERSAHRQARRRTAPAAMAASSRGGAGAVR
ncbi:MAG: hypothetical protein HS111_33095 [Kofleriaceae bacterium]|nr:hypothetical protein [Kofleriaceae bacterium]